MFFSRAALEWLAVSGKQPDIIHLHDWQSAAVVCTHASAARCLRIQWVLKTWQGVEWRNARASFKLHAAK
jgi:glycogen synthase